MAIVSRGQDDRKDSDPGRRFNRDLNPSTSCIICGRPECPYEGERGDKSWFYRPVCETWFPAPFPPKADGREASR